MHRFRKARRGDEGISLIEMIVATTIMLTALTAIAGALVVSVTTTDQTEERLTEAAGVAFASAYFVPDVASAVTVTLGDVTGCPLTGTAVVRLNWTDDGAQQIAAYAVRDYEGSQTLMRRFCVGGSGNEIAIVRGVSGPPTVVCSPNCSSIERRVRMSLSFPSGRMVEVSGSRRVST